MIYRSLGTSGLKISRLGLGSTMFGNRTDEAASARIIAQAAEQGVTLIDTADSYNAGAAEEIIGRAIAPSRARWVLATKVGNSPPVAGEAPLSRRGIQRSIEGSLRRLGTDHVDIYYLHRNDPTTPLAETVRAMADLVRQGKIRYFGVSNHKAWQIADICRLADQMGIDRPVVNQPHYNIVNRTPEVEQLPACAHYGVGVVPYSPLARGVLSGKYKQGEAPAADTRAGGQDGLAKRLMQTDYTPETLEVAQAIDRHARERGFTAAEFAVAWVLNNRLVTGVLGGPRTDEQWASYVRGLDYPFTAEDEALVDRLVAAGHPATPGHTDPAYPVDGRVPWTSPLAHG